jgi:hypothetical protein
MTKAISTIAAGQVWFNEPAVGFDVRTALCAVLTEAGIDGIGTVRMLARDRRQSSANHKVYFVLNTHDMNRDERIVRLMMQFEGVDYDLVPAASAGMIPDGALPVI